MSVGSACTQGAALALATSALALLSLSLPLACSDDSVSLAPALGEPLQVETAQFLPGALPGVPSTGSDADGGVTPMVLDVSVADNAITQGEQGLVFTGHVSSGAQSIAVRFEDMGTGYWVAPVGGPDPSEDGALTWELTADFAHDLPPGSHKLGFATVDADGHSGTQSALSLCVDTPVPDNLNVCAPMRTPPAAVLSLSWNAAVDLDLSVQDPAGATIGGKSAVFGADGGSLTGGATLDHDSNRACVLDGIDREDIVWQAPPASGVYQVWVDLFSSCGLPSTTFTVSLWLAEGQPDGTQRLVQQPTPIASGELLAIQANAGAAKGLFVGQFAVQ